LQLIEFIWRLREKKECFLAGRADKKQDENWLGRLMAGDRHAFAEFVDRYKGSVFVCCRGLGLGEHEAEDVASEVFLAAYKSLGRYRGQAELGTWLWRIAYNKGVSYLRKNRRHVELYEQADEWLAESKSKAVGAELESRQEAEIVWRAVRRLRAEWATAIILFYREEKNISEIAKIMGKRKNTVKTYLFRGRKRLKEIVGPVVGEDVDAD